MGERERIIEQIKHEKAKKVPSTWVLKQLLKEIRRVEDNETNFTGSKCERPHRSATKGARSYRFSKWYE